jgi:hypothetical protein
LKLLKEWSIAVKALLYKPESSYLTGNTHMNSTACCRDSFTFYTQRKNVSHRKNIYGIPRSVTEIALLLLCADDVRTSQETYVWASTAVYGDSFTFLYVDGVRISQEAQLWESTNCYGDSFPKNA